MKQVEPRFRNRFLRRITPTYRVTTVSQLDMRALLDSGVQAIAFDADSTIVEPQKITIRPEVLDFLQTITIPIYVTTNRFAPHGDEIGNLIGAKGVIHATLRYRKPNRRYFKAVEQKADMPLTAIAMVGDRLLTDIVGGNKAGMPTIFVDALGKDPWYMRWTGIRKLELLLLKLLTKH